MGKNRDFNQSIKETIGDAGNLMRSAWERTYSAVGSYSHKPSWLAKKTETKSVTFNNDDCGLHPLN